MDGQCEERPFSKRDALENGPKYCPGQRKVEASCKDLIVGEHLTDERRRIRSFMAVMLCLQQKSFGSIPEMVVVDVI